jgi:hypothetical protein
MKCEGFTRLPTPSIEPVKVYFAMVDVDTFPDLEQWRDVNIRDAKKSGDIPGRIRESLEVSELFSVINRGMLISAKDLRFNNQTGLLELELENPRLHGLMDGGHTYIQVREFAQAEDKSERRVERQFVKVEFLVGVGREGIVDVVDGRNRSNVVRDVSTENLRGTFDKLRNSLRRQPWEDKIAYSEYELDGEGSPKPVGVRHVLKCLSVFDTEMFSEDEHPVRVGTSEEAALDHFKVPPLGRLEAYFHLLPDILRLHDTIRSEFPEKYNAAGGKAGNIAIGDIRIFKKANKHPLHFTGKTTNWRFPTNLVMPVLGAFRACVGKKDGRVAFIRNPFEIFERCGAKLIGSVVADLRDARSVSACVRERKLWETCYLRVSNEMKR